MLVETGLFADKIIININITFCIYEMSCKHTAQSLLEHLQTDGVLQYQYWFTCLNFSCP